MKEFYKGLLVVEDDEVPFGISDDKYIYRSQLNRLKNKVINEIPLEFDTLNYLECNFDMYQSFAYRWA